MSPVDAAELKELLNKGWMTHDAMWFRHCLEECGIEKTNRINRAAVYSAAMIEVRRLARALGVEKIETFEALHNFIRQTGEIIQADFMKFECSSPQKNVLRWDMHQCFAYEGMVRLGAIEQYQCGIFERLKGWLCSLNIEYDLAPEVEGCMMHTDGRCFREFRFSLPVSSGGGASANEEEEGEDRAAPQPAGRGRAPPGRRRRA